MINIYIKSLNRPLFLDRCLWSIHKKVKNFDKIIILDDGTPQHFLDEIKSKYPNVNIEKSEFYNEKSQMISQNAVDVSKFKFPGAFWGREISRSNHDYNLVIEDDMYFVHVVDLEEVCIFMANNNLVFHKFLWAQNENLNKGTIISGCNDHEIIKPDILTANPDTYRLIVENKFFHLSALAFMGLYFRYYINFALKYYTIYVVAGAIFRKDYFNYIWNDISKLNESEQIAKTLEFYKKTNTKIVAGKSKTEFIKQSFLTSATNECKNITTSIFEINRILNDGWLNGDIDPYKDFPGDFRMSEMKPLFDMHDKSGKVYNDWLKWYDWVVTGYSKIGQKFE